MRVSRNNRSVNTQTHTPELPQWQGGMGEWNLPQWVVTRILRGEIQDRETFRSFADAWAYAQPDPENGIHHYIHKDQVLHHFDQSPNTPLTTAYEGNVRIQISVTHRHSSRGAPPHPHRRVQIVT